MQKLLTPGSGMLALATAMLAAPAAEAATTLHYSGTAAGYGSALSFSANELPQERYKIIIETSRPTLPSYTRGYDYESYRRWHNGSWERRVDYTSHWTTDTSKQSNRTVLIFDAPFRTAWLRDDYKGVGTYEYTWSQILFYPADTLPFSYNVTIQLGVVPEPATWGMMILGLGAVGAAMRRRRSVRITYGRPHLA